MCARYVSSSSSVGGWGSLALHGVKHAVRGVQHSCGHEDAQHDSRFHCDTQRYTPQDEPGDAELPHESDDGGAKDGNDE